jgi:hypothetical protein
MKNNPPATGETMMARTIQPIISPGIKDDPALALDVAEAELVDIIDTVVVNVMLEFKHTEKT